VRIGERRGESRKGESKKGKTEERVERKE